MNRHSLKARHAFSAGALAVALCPAAGIAQSFPTKPVRLLTGSAPGGGGDLTSRAIAEKLSAALGQQVIVDNRPGATGMIANRPSTPQALSEKLKKDYQRYGELLKRLGVKGG